MIHVHSFTVNFGAKYLTGMVTSVPPYETFSLIKNNILHQSKNYKNHFENSNFWGMSPLGLVGHVTHSFINLLFLSTGIFDNKLRPQILSLGTTANSPLIKNVIIMFVWIFSITFLLQAPPVKLTHNITDSETLTPIIHLITQYSLWGQ